MNAELTAFLDWDSVAGNRLEFELGSHLTTGLVRNIRIRELEIVYNSIVTTIQ